MIELYIGIGLLIASYVVGKFSAIIQYRDKLHIIFNSVGNGEEEYIEFNSNIFNTDKEKYIGGASYKIKK